MLEDPYQWRFQNVPKQAGIILNVLYIKTGLSPNLDKIILEINSITPAYTHWIWMNKWSSTFLQKPIWKYCFLSPLLSQHFFRWTKPSCSAVLQRPPFWDLSLVLLLEEFHLYWSEAQKLYWVKMMFHNWQTNWRITQIFLQMVCPPAHSIRTSGI